MRLSRALRRARVLIAEGGAVSAASEPGQRLSPRQFALLLAALLPGSFLLAVTVGAVSLPLLDSLGALLGLEASATAELIVYHIRIPRALLAALVGALLGISGAAMQGLFRNPLADPSLIGVTAGAVAGATLVIVLGGAGLGAFWGISLASFGAFIGGAAAVLLVYRLARRDSGSSVATMLLLGIAVTALAGSFNSLMEFIANNELLRHISLWKMGGLDGANYQRILIVAAVAAPVLAALPRYAAPLNAMLLGESEARYLGVDVSRVQRDLVGLVAAAVGVSVALVGAVSFVGLVVPHSVRLLIGPDHRYVLPGSAAAGAVLMLLADSLARTIIAPTELPVGIVTALVGAPFFIVLLRERQYGAR